MLPRETAMTEKWGSVFAGATRGGLKYVLGVWEIGKGALSRLF